MLSEYQVPMVRAIWLIKMTAAYTVAISEAKMKKRQLPDSSQGLTLILLLLVLLAIFNLIICDILLNRMDVDAVSLSQGTAHETARFLPEK